MSKQLCPSSSATLLSWNWAGLGQEYYMLDQSVNMSPVCAVQVRVVCTAQGAQCVEPLSWESHLR